jgi:ferritin-like protein
MITFLNKKINNMKYFNKLYEKIDIDDTEYRKLDDNQYYLILYFLVNESGAIKKWKEIYDYYGSTDRVRDKYSEYISDSEYDSYLTYIDLVKYLAKIYSFIDYKNIDYYDYILEMVDKNTKKDE